MILSIKRQHLHNLQHLEWLGGMSIDITGMTLCYVNARAVASLP